MLGFDRLIEAQGLRADLIALSAGALAALALPPVHALPVLLVAFPVLLAQIRAAGRPIIAARRGWSFGFGYHLIGLYWITEAILFEAARFWWLVPLAVPALSAVLALFVAVAAWAASGLRPETHQEGAALLDLPPKGEALWDSSMAPGMGGADMDLERSPSAPPIPGAKVNGSKGQALGGGPGGSASWWGPGRGTAAWPQALTLAGAWVLADLARQFVLTGFPWNPIGSVWAVPGPIGDVMLQPAALMSVHGLTLVTIILACAPLFRWPGRAIALAGLTVWAGFGVARVSEPPPPARDLRVVLVQGNVAQGQKWDPAFVAAVFERYLRLTEEGLTAAGPGPRVAVWPETASFYQLGTDDPARREIAAAARGQPVLAGAVRFDQNDRPRNTLFALTGLGGIAALYDKWHLVPFGEYQPSWAQVGVQLVPGGGFASGPGPATLRMPGVPPVGPLICYEAIFPGQVVDEADRPDWMVNVTNDAWFGTSSGPRQHLAAARLRAVEEGLPLLRAANTGISVAFDSKGHEITRIGMEQAGFRVVTLPGRLPPTLFSRVGLLMPGALAACVLCLGLGVFWGRRRGRHR